MIFKFLDGVTTDTTGGTWSVDTDSFYSITVQASVTTAASINIQGRITGITEWVTLNDTAITADKAVEVKSMPEMRVVATGVTGALSVYGFGSRTGR